MKTIQLEDLSPKKRQSLLKYKQMGATKEQICELALGLYNDVNMEKIDNLSLSAKAMREIRLGEQNNLITDLYSNFEADKMYELRYGMICGKQDKRDMSLYLDFNTKQLYEINEAYSDGLTREQISWFANKLYSEQIMNRLRKLIKSEQIKSENDIPTTPSETEESNLKILDDLLNGVKSVEVKVSHEKPQLDIDKALVESTEHFVDDERHTINDENADEDDEDADAFGSLGDFFDVM